jgi:hypothetical protein
VYPNDRAQVIAPFKFHLVSIFPTVIVLAGHDFGPIKNRSIDDLVGSAPRNSLGDSRVLNHLEFGTSFLDATEFYWFSPDLDIPITKLTVDRSGFVIQHPKISLIGKRSGGNVFVERIK